jgi:hypothetical protein
MAKNKEVVKEKEFKSSDKIPLGVKIISILFYIGTVICLVFGLVLVFGSKIMVASLIASNPGVGLESIPQGKIVTLIVVLGILFIAASVFAFLIGRGIWRLRKWARITAMILAIIGFAFAVFSVVISFRFMQIISLLIDGFIGGYLLLSKEARRVFK